MDWMYLPAHILFIILHAKRTASSTEKVYGSQPCSAQKSCRHWNLFQYPSTVFGFALPCLRSVAAFGSAFTSAAVGLAPLGAG